MQSVHDDDRLIFSLAKNRHLPWSTFVTIRFSLISKLPKLITNNLNNDPLIQLLSLKA